MKEPLIMLFSPSPAHSIFIGDATNPLISHKKIPEFQTWMVGLNERLGLDGIIVQRQVHGVDGMVVQAHANGVSIFKTEGDWLITNQPNIGIAILTADCLPIVFYEPTQQIVGVAHAGWRGSVANIGGVVIAEMQKAFGIKPEDVVVHFGPAARKCCYEVTPEFLGNLEQFDFKDLLVEKGDGKLFF